MQQFIEQLYQNETLTKRRKIKAFFQGQSRNQAVQKEGMMCLAERVSEREKQQRINCWGEQKVQSAVLPVFNIDQKNTPTFPLPQLHKTNRVGS